MWAPLIETARIRPLLCPEPGPGRFWGALVDTGSGGAAARLGTFEFTGGEALDVTQGI